MTLEFVIEDIDFWESPRLPIRKEEILFVEGEKVFKEESFEKRRKKKSWKEGFDIGDRHGQGSCRVHTILESLRVCFFFLETLKRSRLH